MAKVRRRVLPLLPNLLVAQFPRPKARLPPFPLSQRMLGWFQRQEIE